MTRASRSSCRTSCASLGRMRPPTRWRRCCAATTTSALSRSSASRPSRTGPSARASSTRPPAAPSPTPPRTPPRAGCPSPTGRPSCRLWSRCHSRGARSGSRCMRRISISWRAERPDARRCFRATRWTRWKSARRSARCTSRCRASRRPYLREDRGHRALGERCR